MNLTSTIMSTLTSTAVPAMAKTTDRFFSWYDYGIFCTMLAMSGGIGIYFGCFGQKQTTAKEYLLGGREMKVIPIVISLVASHTSGVTLLAVPAEVYTFGAGYWLSGISYTLVAVITIFVYLPVFYKLQLTSTYEYIGHRFDRKSRKLASVLYAVSVFLYIPIVIYIPSLAFSAATGIDVHIITPVVCGICIFYTTIGGLKALVWTDTMQFSLTVISVIAISFLGIRASGGIGNVWKTAVEGERLDLFHFELDFIARDSFWTIVIGLTIHFVAHTSINQGCTQKFLAVPDLKDSKITVVFYTLGMVLVKTLSIMSGLTIYAIYSKCDPLASKKIHSDDEILPYYVLNVAGNVPGLSGLFIAGVFCASLSALSANMNCLAGTIYQDFFKTKLEKKGYTNASYVLKILVVIIGVTGTFMVYIVEHLGGLLALAIGLGSIAHGPLLGMFTQGLLFPRANAKGAFYGGLISSFCMGLLISANSYYKSMGLLKYPLKPVSTEGCELLQNITTHSITSEASDVFPLFRISFYWFTMIGAIICMVVGLLIGYMSKEKEPTVARELLSPVIYGIIDQEKYKNRMNLDYSSIEESLNKLANSERRRSSRWESMREERLRKISAISEVFDT